MDQPISDGQGSYRRQHGGRQQEDQLHTDVLVVGGGTAGVTAAISAAEEGASVVLIERDSGLGGVGIRAGVHTYYLGTKGGIQDQLDQRVLSLNQQMGSASKGFTPESKGLAISARIQELGILVIYESIVSEVIMENNQVCGAIVESGRGTIRIESAILIDSTADGDISYLAGAEYTLGREWDGALHNFSLVPRTVDAKNQLRCKNFDIGWVDVTDPADISRAYRAGRRHAWRGGENPLNMHYTVIGPQLGLREGRLIQGEHILNQHDFLVDRRFEDVVMRCFAHHENHAFDYANESEWSQIWVAMLGMWRFGFGGDVPYRCFVPKEIDGLLIGCRAFSQDHDTAMMLRMQRDLHKIGEVVGTAAALSVKHGVIPRHIPVAELQQRLLSRGVLKEDEISGDSKPWVTLEGESTENMSRLLKEGATAAEVEKLIGYLGGDEESAALWWLWTLGDACVPVLLEALSQTEGRHQRGIAFALGLLGQEAAVPVLAAIFRSRDADRPNTLTRTEESWVSALVLLKNMKNSTVATDVIELLRTEKRSATLLFMLHYLISVADQLSGSMQAETREAVEVMLADPELGNDFVLHHSGEELPALPDTRSMRWGIELAAAYVLELVGGKGRRIFNGYRQDHRGYARVAANKLSERLTAWKGV
ncbi:FAD-dependent oxidoreductase [Paenibacillus puerhi]|uniref:FAD-dependent oxidoreductase n=1 Tax=Paenibacillus puerhi TaxID=2692622 RepID=UPI001356788D|nr:FAD-dependent oxidoreductase [Paenibacillus puerhi]